MHHLGKEAATKLVDEKMVEAWAKIANAVAAGPPAKIPATAPGKTAKGGGIPAPKNPAAKTSNIKPIKVSMNTRGAMPQ